METDIWCTHFQLEYSRICTLSNTNRYKGRGDSIRHYILCKSVCQSTICMLSYMFCILLARFGMYLEDTVKRSRSNRPSNKMGTRFCKSNRYLCHLAGLPVDMSSKYQHTWNTSWGCQSHYLWILKDNDRHMSAFQEHIREDIEEWILWEYKKCRKKDHRPDN